MTTARDIMTPDTEYMRTNSTVQQAASLLASTGVGAIPVCELDGRIVGMLTDRDIVVRVVAKAKDPSAVSLAEIVDGSGVVIVDADDDVEVAIETMKAHQVRRLPVVEENQLVGMISQGDIARHSDPEKVGDMVAVISS
ncbi:MAG TPA: CBS domain-containing protein [Acidimicrobiales bacterium]|nr:CBS domain-containing protein [Acidimicrobiales bacterium]